MAVTLYLRSSTKHLLGRIGSYDLLDTRGSSSVERAVPTQASGTDIQWTENDGTTVLEWWSPPLAADYSWLSTDNITFNIWARESNMNANCGAKGRAAHWSRIWGPQAAYPTGGLNDGVEFTTSDAVYNWTGALGTALSAKRGDRIGAKLYITNVGTMGGGFTCTLSFDGPTGAADGDSFITFPGTPTFANELQGGILLNQPASPTGIGLYGHPLCPDHAWFFEHGNGITNCRFPDLVGHSHAKGDRIDTAYPGVSRRYGRGFWFRSGSGSKAINLGRNLKLWNPNGQFTIVINYRLNDAYNVISEDWNQQIISAGGSTDADADSDALVTAMIGGASNAVNLNHRANTGAGFTTLSYIYSAISELTGDNIWAYSSGPRGMDIWKNGLKLASNSTVVGATTYNDQRTWLGSAKWGETPPMQVGFVYLYKRQLTPQQMAEVTKRPF